MPFRLKLDETLESGFHRIAGEQFKIALDALAAESPARGIHECRKALKRLRALVRLFAPALGAKRARRRLGSLAGVARLLADHRDQAVVVEMLSRLQKTADEDSAQAIAMLRLEVTDVGAATGLVAENDRTMLVAARLAEEAQAFAALRLRDESAASLRAGLRKSYRSARRALKAAHAGGGDAELYHGLRKSAQWHWRQMSLFANAWPAEFGARAAAAREISRLLGDDHDISLVARHVTRSRVLSGAQRNALLGFLECRQATLRKQALFEAEQLLSERSRAFARRAIGYWRSGVHAGIGKRELAAPAPASAKRTKSNKPATKAAGQRAV